MDKIFLKRGSIYQMADDNFQKEKFLGSGLFVTRFNPDTKQIFLEKIGEKFNFDFKIYGEDSNFINHIIGTYKNEESKHNLGILLNGIKGTGKTVTAKLIANRLELPIIVCDAFYPGLDKFILSMEESCTFFFDEFEKIYSTGDEMGNPLLSVMDGAYNLDHPHVFLLTTNSLNINDNFLSRPSRVRYLKNYGQIMDKDLLVEIVDDCLKYPEYKDDLIGTVDKLSMSTIDILKAIIEEVNVHKCPASEFIEFFNVSYLRQTLSYFSARFGQATKESFLRNMKALEGEGELDKAEYRTYYHNSLVVNSMFRLTEGGFFHDKYRVSDIDVENNYFVGEFCGEKYHMYCQGINKAPSLYNEGKYGHKQQIRWISPDPESFTTFSLNSM